MKKKDARVAVIDLPGDRRARIAPETEEGKGGSQKPVARTRLIGQMPHDDMRNRGQIDGSQHAAAERLLSNYVRAGLVPVKSQAFERVDQSPATTPDHALRAKEEYFEDLKLLEPRGASLVHNVCCEGITCTEWARRMDVAVQYATERLRESLGVLAKHHGL